MAADTAGSGALSKALRQSRAAPAIHSPPASAASSSTARSHASSSAPLTAPPPHCAIQSVTSRALPAARA
eukprot:2027052-Lingulodinium_polyedra.AAC.1